MEYSIKCLGCGREEKLSDQTPIREDVTRLQQEGWGFNLKNRLMCPTCKRAADEREKLVRESA
ncbi:MAG TPA: hypothetical protein PLK80_03290 [bacterium]|nr:MAG: hypothetical protein BWY28_02152 [bacterium ADurb.Bin236]HOY61645.1 hypothetical protein [bacterium]HPI75731.1 hypothetical protein [bacterium]HPN95048.1 hypothetical protein [bacterium]